MVFLRSLSHVTGRQTLGYLSHLLSRKRGSRAPAHRRILLETFILALATLLLTAVYNRLVGAQSGVVVLSVKATQPIASATPGVFTITRSGDTSQPVTVQLSLTGTARRDVDYTLDTQAASHLPLAFVQSGKVAQAFSFDGQKQYVQGPDDPKLAPLEEASVDAWVFFNELPSVRSNLMMIVDKSSFGNDFLLDAETDNKFHFSVLNGRKVDSTTVIQTGRWYHVAATYKALTEVKIYVNGVLENKLAINQRRVSSNGVPFTIGRTGVGLTFLVGPAYFSGLIDEVHVFNRVLSGAEIGSIKAADSAGLCKPVGLTPNCAQSPAGLVGWFAGDGDASNTVDNAFASGKVAQAFQFAGEYVQYRDNPNQDPTTEATLTAWVNFTGLPSEEGRFMTIIDKSVQFKELSLVAVGDNTIRFFLPFANVASNTVVQKGRWYHVAATFKAKAELKMYINGVLENTQAISGGRAASGSPLLIGNTATDPTRLFSGLIDEAQMYNRALSASEIQSIFNADSAGLCKPVAVLGCIAPPAGLVGWWPGDGPDRGPLTTARGTLIGYDGKIIGQDMTLPAGQTSITVNVRPIFSANTSGKTVVLTLLPDTQNSYSLDALASSATVFLSGRSSSTDMFLTNISPNEGGDTGSVTPVIYGQGCKTGATVKLVGAGQPDIIATQTNPAADESSAAATFDLNGKAQGVYDVVVANAGGTANTLAGAFTIEPTAPGSLYVKVISRKIIRIGNEYPFYVLYGKSGNTDATNVPFYLSVPSFVSITPDTTLSYQTAQINGRTVISLTLPRVRAISDQLPDVLAVKIKVTDPNRFHNPFRLRAAFNLPYVT